MKLYLPFYPPSRLRHTTLSDEMAMRLFNLDLTPEEFNLEQQLR